MIGSAVSLLVLGFLAQSIGTTLRRGRDGLSQCHVLTVRIILAVITVASLVFAIVKASHLSRDGQLFIHALLTCIR